MANYLVKDYLYEAESDKIKIAATEVFRQFGGAFKESIVDNALTIALKNEGLKVIDQKRIEIFFKDRKVGTYVPDKIINDKILIEVKCKSMITDADMKQFWYYLKASDYKVGYIINFSPNKLDIKRRVYDTARQKVKTRGGVI